MGRNAVETVMGALVILVAAVFLYIAYNTAEIKSVSGYPLSVAFAKVGGLGKGADVRISGIKVGTVTDVRLDAATYDAVVSMSIAPTVRLPADTEAAIASEGLLGGMYVRLLPGTAKDKLADGGKIARSRDFESLEDQVGKIIFLATSPAGKGDDDSGGGGGLPKVE